MDGLITSRPVQNEATGIDLHVPLYQEIRGPIMTGHVEYQIIVVTRLAAFKSPRHKPGDTVQLVVPKKYSEIDEFYYRIMAQYPKISLPAMPRKALFVGESDIRERRGAFDELVKFIAQNPTLAACPEVLEFLGARSTEADIKARNVTLGEEPDEDINFFQGDKAAPVVGPVESGMEEGKDEDQVDKEEPYLGPLGNTKLKKKKTTPSAPPKTVKKVSLFGDDQPDDTDLFQLTTKNGDLKLFENPDLGGRVKLGDSLLLPTAYQQAGASTGLDLDEDTEELFRVEDDFDKLLQVTKHAKDKPTPKPKPQLKAKPTSNQQLPGGTDSLGRPAIAADQLKDQMDILRYIQENESGTNDDEDLF